MGAAPWPMPSRSTTTVDARPMMARPAIARERRGASRRADCGAGDRASEAATTPGERRNDRGATSAGIAPKALFRLALSSTAPAQRGQARRCASKPARARGESSPSTYASTSRYQRAWGRRASKIRIGDHVTTLITPVPLDLFPILQEGAASVLDRDGHATSPCRPKCASARRPPHSRSPGCRPVR